MKVIIHCSAAVEQSFMDQPSCLLKMIVLILGKWEVSFYFVFLLISLVAHKAHDGQNWRGAGAYSTCFTVDQGGMWWGPFEGGV